VNLLTDEDEAFLENYLKDNSYLFLHICGYKNPARVTISTWRRLGEGFRLSDAFRIAALELRDLGGSFRGILRDEDAPESEFDGAVFSLRIAHTDGRFHMDVEKQKVNAPPVEFAEMFAADQDLKELRFKNEDGREFICEPIWWPNREFGGFQTRSAGLWPVIEKRQYSVSADHLNALFQAKR
jgi:hypothetical protein